jgi:hypothetical protein
LATARRDAVRGEPIEDDGSVTFALRRSLPMVLAETLLFGDSETLLAYLVLAFGGAMAVGNVLAIVKPPEAPRGERDLAQAPKGRSIFFAVLGGVAALWALASLIT